VYMAERNLTTGSKRIKHAIAGHFHWSNLGKDMFWSTLNGPYLIHLKKKEAHYIKEEIQETRGMETKHYMKKK
jgi:hypothetical protein